jgi:hypothetical protein
VTSVGGLSYLQGDGNGRFTLEPTSTLVPGLASPALAVGDFNGDSAPDLIAGYAASDNVAVLLNEAGTHTTLAASANPTGFEEGVTFTATVAANMPGNGMPTGSVTFLNGGVPLATVSLNSSGQASFTAFGLMPGNHVIAAMYNGDGTFFGSSVARFEGVNSLGDITSRLTITPGRLRRSRQKVTLKNTGNQAISGPFWLLLTGLDRHIKLRRQKGVSTGVTHLQPAPGSAFEMIEVPLLQPGQKTTLTLLFRNPTGRRIRYTPRVLAGTGPL